MIRILPCFVAAQRKNVVANGNAHFNLQLPHDLLLSYPAGYYSSSPIDNQNMLISKGFSDYYIYRYREGKIEQEKPSEQLVECYQGSKWLVEKHDWPKKTVLVECETDAHIEVEGKYNYVIAEEASFIVLGNRKHVSAFSKSTGQLIWIFEKEGQRFPSTVNGCLVFYVKDTENWKTKLIFREIETGRVFREVTLNYSGHIAHSSADHFILVGSKMTGNRPSAGIIHYNWNEETVKEVVLEDSPPYLGLYGGDMGIFCKQENQVDVWKSGDEGTSFIGAIDIDTGKRISQIDLPNICFPQTPNFAVHNGTYFASGIARTPWPASYWQMVLWDKEDFFNPNPEVYEEPLMGSWDKVIEEEQSTYRVYVDKLCENFFQLHRQLSVTLHQCGAIHGFHKNSEGKERDPNFNGRIICDVSNHELNDQEKLAIKNLCPFIELELAEGGFRSSYDPADRIAIEPSF